MYNVLCEKISNRHDFEKKLNTIIFLFEIPLQILMVLSALSLALVQILRMWRASSLKKDESTSKIMTA